MKLMLINKYNHMRHRLNFFFKNSRASHDLLAKVDSPRISLLRNSGNDASKFFLCTLVIVFLVCGSVTSCNRKPDGSITMQPNNLDLTPPPGPPLYQQGWSDGCESGANSYSNPFYKTVKAFEFKYDPRLRNNKEYYQAWKDAFVYCSIFWERTNQPEI